MDQSSDDVLLMVMQYLDVKDVLACRLVCKRLADLALHRDVWRHRTVSDNDPCANAVLHLAPCLHKLEVCSVDDALTLALTTTRCAVASLVLRHNQFHGLKSALVVRNQETLGRLKHVVVGNCDFDHGRGDADVFLRTVATCSGLESLEFEGYPPFISRPFTSGPPVPSLVRLRCPAEERRYIADEWVSNNAMSFVNTILTGHAETLEEIDLLNISYSDMTTVSLLCAMPKLHILSCNNGLPGLEFVAECKTLRELTLCVYSFLPDSDEGTTKFLLRAKQLRKMHLDYIDAEPNVNFGVGLIEDLTSCRRPRLERMSLEGFVDVRRLLHALPQLPALRYLDVSSAEPDDELLLLSITPASAPALRALELSHSYKTRCKCMHSWLHWETLKATLKANPSLHIRVNGYRVECDRQHCDACTLQCHQEMRKSEGITIGIFAHSLDKCSAPEDHSPDRPWIPI